MKAKIEDNELKVEGVKLEDIYIDCAKCGKEVSLEQAWFDSEEVDLVEAEGKIKDNGDHKWETTKQAFYCCESHGVADTL